MTDRRSTADRPDPRWTWITARDVGTAGDVGSMAQRLLKVDRGAGVRREIRGDRSPDPTRRSSYLRLLPEPAPRSSRRYISACRSSIAPPSRTVVAQASHALHVRRGTASQRDGGFDVDETEDSGVSTG